MAAAARVVAGIVAQHTRVVCVAGTRLRRQLCVVVRALIGVADDGADGRAGRFAIVDSGLNLRPVRLLACGGLLVAARCAALHLAQDKRLVIRHTGRESVDHNADARAMRFTENGNFNCIAPGRTHVSPSLQLQNVFVQLFCINRGDFCPTGFAHEDKVDRCTEFLFVRQQSIKDGLAVVF